MHGQKNIKEFRIVYCQSSRYLKKPLRFQIPIRLCQMQSLFSVISKEKHKF